MLEWIFLLLVVLLILLLWHNQKLSKQIEQLVFDKKSTFVKHGKAIEQLFPFFKTFQYNPQKFRFIGSPVDGIQFEDDKIVFIEFKTGKSKLSKGQEHIKNIINKKKVEFREIRT